ncbi:MAG: hypothetical protein PHO48_05045 [Candidatus Gracilibacteria bacterium]|nr:hypothetical protein [Candidatus Gracilibacteria bacterium]MDD5178875.1 hypothetical protein [Candidatus Gracilibacteria bacterium]
MQTTHLHNHEYLHSLAQGKRVVFLHPFEVGNKFDVIATPSEEGPEPKDWRKEVRGDAIGVRHVKGLDQVRHYNAATAEQLKGLKGSILQEIAGAAEGSSAEQIDNAFIKKIIPLIAEMKIDLGVTKPGDTFLKVINKAVSWNGGGSDFAKSVQAQEWYDKAKFTPRTIAAIQKITTRIITSAANREGFNVDYIVPGMKLAMENGGLVVREKAKRQAAPDIGGDNGNPKTIEGMAAKDRGFKEQVVKNTQAKVDILKKKVGERTKERDTEKLRVDVSGSNLGVIEKSLKAKQAELDAAYIWSPIIKRDLAKLTEQFNESKADLAGKQKELAAKQKVLDEATAEFTAADSALNGRKTTYEIADRAAERYKTK